MTGSLYLISTPIGNLEDITYRALRILKEEVTLLACEDTRNTKKLLTHFDIKVPLVSYHEHNKNYATQQLIDKLKSGETIGLVSDAGMPCISDPGYELVVACYEENISVVPLPGANAALTALIASGLSAYQFTFNGFLPRQKKDLQNALEKIMNKDVTQIIYESPHRIVKTIEMINKIDRTRQVTVARELTKRFEQIVTQPIHQIVEALNNGEIPIKGEFVVIIDAAKEIIEDIEVWWANLSIESHVEHYVNDGMTPNQAIKQTAIDREMPKREVYQHYHLLNKTID